jgi:hypothetical protein
MDAIDSFLVSFISKDHKPDTTFSGLRYDTAGRVVRLNSGAAMDSTGSILPMILPLGKLARSSFHQCYINHTRMERFLVQKTGFLPKVILIEVHPLAVFSFVLNEGKYYRARDIDLMGL